MSLGHVQSMFEVVKDARVDVQELNWLVEELVSATIAVMMVGAAWKMLDHVMERVQ